MTTEVSNALDAIEAAHGALAEAAHDLVAKVAGFEGAVDVLRGLVTPGEGMPLPSAANIPPQVAVSVREKDPAVLARELGSVENVITAARQWLA